MSVYRDTNANVTFEHPFPGPLTAKVYRGGELILTSGSLMPTAGIYTLGLTWKETQFDGDLEIRWEGGTLEDPFVRTTLVSVITPLVPLSKLQTLFSDTNWTDAELSELEEKTRVFIESYTGQSFGYLSATYAVVGSGEQRLLLPRRLIKFSAISGGIPSYFTLASDGWQLLIRSKNYLEIKEAPPEEFSQAWTHGVIVVPEVYWRKFRSGAEYLITGEWGYYTVPADVQEAAMLLANDFACGDSIYRDRYLELIKAGDWNMKFSPGAYRGTGNARADQLLDKYRRTGMVII